MQPGECTHRNVIVAEVTEQTGLIFKDDANYRQEADHFVAPCADNYLELNVKNMKEMILDFRKDRVVFREIFIITEIARRVENY